ncbi:MAG: acetyl-CoA carboxylase biotin carboxyl carrier protein subunit [Flavobacteria bacterium RIFCSPLOWO2_12_FULL_31_7]|nr:MAG: acetyl-CoA carboxylase biotin carboxyl carrier protein subunit [Flavobacteria bacterium RIFCSPLOWO2_12_FULL_31_7]
MSKPYKVSVNQNQVFQLTENSLTTLDAVSVEENHFHILNENTPFQAEICAADFNSRKYSVKVNGNTYDVSIANELDLLIESMGISVGAGKVVNEIKAPMPGLILEVCVAVGQEVAENEALLILEAMKMENTLVSPRSGKIKSIAVEKSNAVEKGQLLIEFE